MGKFSARMNILIISACLLLAGCRQNRGATMELSSPAADRANAQSLMVSYAKHADAYDSAHSDFDNNGDRSFGDFGFRYFPDRDTLQVRFLILSTYIKEYPQTEVPTRQTVAGLNDAAIGGMYDRGGGTFVFDEAKEKVFLVRDFPVASTTTESFLKDVDNLHDLSAVWVTKWAGIVANQSHGARPKPTQHVTRENDPYPRGY